nr:hypothetical protein [uncultured Flavobacterium sp.]
MTLNQQTELKEAILNQSQKEKDKLLVRLINKDKKLMEQLHFLLLENEDDLLNRIQKVKTQLENLFETAQKFISRKKTDYKHKELTAWLKSASGLVNEYAAITKNKESELDLRLLILEEAFDTYFNLYQNESSGFKSDAHFTYVAARIKAILTIYQKLHEDLQFEYRDRINHILDFSNTSQLKEYIDF